MYDTGVTYTEFDKDVLLRDGNKHLFLSDEMILVKDLDGIFLACSYVACTHHLKLLRSHEQTGGVGYKGCTHGRVRSFSKGVSKREFLGTSESTICTPRPTRLP